MLHVEHISYLITNHAQSLVNSSPLDKMTTISQMMCDMAFIEPMHRNKANITYFTGKIFTCIFVNEKLCILIKISLKFVPKGSIDNNPALV